MVENWIGIALVLTTFAALFGIFSLIGPLLQPEVLRKGLHVSMGLTTLSFPWLFPSAWPVVLVAGACAVAFLALHAHLPLLRRLAHALERIKRVSVGEFCFVLATATVFAIARDDPVLYCIPMLLLTLADAAAALVGTAYGRHRYACLGDYKTVEGSAAFLAVAFVCIAVPLACFTSASLGDALAVAALVSVAATVLEGALGAGIDNLLVPLATVAAIKYTGLTSRSASALKSASPIAMAAVALTASLLVLFVIALASWLHARRPRATSARE
jgi:phytol kinase